MDELLREIIDSEIDFVEETQKRKKELELELESAIERRNRSIVELEKVSHNLGMQEQRIKELKQTLQLLAEQKEIVEKYKKAIKIEEKLEILIEKFWNTEFSEFLKKIRDRVNKYFSTMDMPLGLIIKGNEMKAEIHGEETDFNTLSAGERGFLNILIRIATLQELEMKQILILEHPIAFLDEERTQKFLLILNKLKTDFSQIIMTTLKTNLALKVENTINLI